MVWQVVEYRHPAISVKVGAKTYRFNIRDDRTIERTRSDDDGSDAAHKAAVTYLKGYQRWFGHWIPIDPRTDGSGGGILPRTWRWSTDRDKDRWQSQQAASLR